MIKTAHYQVIPFFRHGSKLPTNQINNGTDWLRGAINMMVNRFKGKLKSRGIETNVFHNHVEDAAKTIVRYPLVQYQRVDADFWVTGINQGAEALEVLLEDNKEMIMIDKHLYLQFLPEQVAEQVVVVGNEDFQYQLTDWLALNNTNHQYHTFQSTSSLKERVSILEAALQNQIMNDFAKYLNISTDGIQIQITDLGMAKQRNVIVSVNGNTKRYFKTFDIAFNINLPLPDRICLGNHKMYGFGMLQKIFK